MDALLANLPIALALLVCPLMMFFMMHGGHQHGGHQHGGHQHGGDAHAHGDAHEHDRAAPQPGAGVGTPRDRMP